MSVESQQLQARFIIDAQINTLQALLELGVVADRETERILNQATRELRQAFWRLCTFCETCRKYGHNERSVGCPRPPGLEAETPDSDTETLVHEAPLH